MTLTPSQALLHKPKSQESAVGLYLHSEKESLIKKSHVIYVPLESPVNLLLLINSAVSCTETSKEQRNLTVFCFCSLLFVNLSQYILHHPSPLPFNSHFYGFLAPLVSRCPFLCTSLSPQSLPRIGFPSL